MLLVNRLAQIFFRYFIFLAETTVFFQ